MPLYEYHCPKCNEDFELLIFGAQVPNCPHCGAEELKRQMSVSAGHVRSGAARHCPGPSEACGLTAACRGCSRE